MDYAAILNAKFGDRPWAGSDTYESLVALDGGEVPSKKVLDALWPEVQYDREVAAIKAARRARYQAETDGLYFDAMRAHTPSLAEWQAAVDQIKAELPYPEAPA